MENFPKTTKSRLGADFSLDHTGVWGGFVSNIMIMIGNLRVIKGLTGTNLGYDMMCESVNSDQ